MRSRTKITVKRRRVFYIPGYDPIHPRRYRALYRKEAAAQAAISGYGIELRAAGSAEQYGWRVDAAFGATAVATDVEMLVWSDIVRTSMNTSIPATYGQLVRTAWVYTSTGALWRLMRLRKGPVIAALYPVGMLLIQLVLAFCAGVLAAWLGIFALSPLIGIWAQVIAIVISAVAAVWVLRWFKKNDGRFFAYYLMHDYAYGAATRGAYSAQLEARLTQFSDRITDAMADDCDEVLVVGHSSGAHLGISVLADLIRAGRVDSKGPALAFLSLGQVVPMISFLPDATRLRGDLAYLSASEALTWADVTAPGDGCAIALCDPVAVSGVAPENKH